MTKVLVCGAAGKMGREVIKAVHHDNDLVLVSAVDHHLIGEDIGTVVGIEQLNVYIENDLVKALEAYKPDVVVDFTSPNTIFHNACETIKRGVHCVIGTTGLTLEQRNDLHQMSLKYKANVLVAPNFSLGAVMMMKISAELAPYFPDVEIIELHHNHKYDAPSGTAILTAKLISEARKEAKVEPQADLTKESLTGSRGAKVDNVTIHSVRLPGYIAHQQVLFGGNSEILTIRHDSMNRESFMPGVVLACKKIKDHQGLVYGLEHYL